MIDDTVREFFKFGILGMGWVLAIWLIIREGLRQERILKVVENNTKVMATLCEKVENLKDH